MTAFYLLSALAAAALGAMVWGGARRAARATAAVAAAAATTALLLTGGVARPGAPLAGRLEALRDAPDETVSPPARAALHRLDAKRAPNDPDAWTALGYAEARLGRWAQAISAFETALRLDDAPDRLVDLADALSSRDAGVVGPQARALAAGALAQDPESVRAQRLLAIAQLQDGDVQGAVEAWSGLIERLAPQDARARVLASEAAGLLSRPQAGPARGAGGGDGGAPVFDAGGDPAAMVRAMVARLDARLAEDPSDFVSWLVLARARGQLGDWPAAAAALEGAQNAADRPGAEAILDAAANGLLALAEARRADISRNASDEEGS